MGCCASGFHPWYSCDPWFDWFGSALHDWQVAIGHLENDQGHRGGVVRAHAEPGPPGAVLLAAGEEFMYRLGDDRHAWVQVVRGAVLLNGTPLTAGDGAAVSKEMVLQLRATDAAELLLFDLA